MEKKIEKVFIVTVALGNDGAERVLSELSNYWVNNGIKVIIIQTEPGKYGCTTYHINPKIDLINIHSRQNNKLLRYIFASREVIKILNASPKSPVISFLSSTSFILSLCKPFIHNKIIVSERNDPTKCPKGKIQQIIRDIAFEAADCCVFQTEDAKLHFSKKIQNKGVIIPNPISDKLPEPCSYSRKHNIVTACRLHPQKNLRLLIDAFNKVHREFPDYYLDIYGQGDEENLLKQYVCDLGLQESVFFKGFVKDIHAHICDSQMYVCSSNYEGISNSILEAMGMGIPTISTDCPVGGSSLLIENNTNGILVRVGDIDGMYKAMKRIIKDPAFAQKLSMNATRVKEKYSLDKISDRWMLAMNK